MGDISLYSRLIAEEGVRTHLYEDTKGILTIGIGYNIEERGLPEDIIHELYKRDLMRCRQEAAVIPGFLDLDEVRQTVVIAMVFQMGLSRVLKFKKFIAALQEQDYDKAAAEMLDSKWAREDSPARARREAHIMKTGRYQ